MRYLEIFLRIFVLESKKCSRFKVREKRRKVSAEGRKKRKSQR
jgi:hypothetical protein